MQRSRGQSSGARSGTLGERAVGGGAFVMGVGAFVGHLIAPDRIADHYRWPRARWYQREIGAFNAGLAAGVSTYALGRREDAFIGSWTVAAALLSLTRAAAWSRGERSGPGNAALVIEDGVLALGGIALLIGKSRARSRT